MIPVRTIKTIFTIIPTLFFNNIYYPMIYSLFLNLLGSKYNTTTSSDLKLSQINWNTNSTATRNCKTVAKLEAAWLYPFLLIFNITKLRETAKISSRFYQMSWFKLQVNIQTYNWNHYKTSITFETKRFNQPVTDSSDLCILISWKVTSTIYIFFLYLLPIRNKTTVFAFYLCHIYLKS